MEPPLQAVISLDLNHNHQTSSADALRYLKPGPEVRETFYGYFDQGMTHKFKTKN